MQEQEEKDGSEVTRSDTATGSTVNTDANSVTSEQFL